MKDFLTADEVAARLQVHPATVYRMATREWGEQFKPVQPPLPLYRIGAKARIDPFAFENWFRGLQGKKPFTEEEFVAHTRAVEKLHREPDAPPEPPPTDPEPKPEDEPEVALAR